MKTSEACILEQYDIGDAKVTITDTGRYMVDEPQIPSDTDEMYDKIIKKMEMTTELTDETDEEVTQKFEKTFWDTAKRLEIYESVVKKFSNIRYYIRRDMLGNGLLDVPMRDPSIEDILCSAYDRNIHIVHKKYSGQFQSLESNIKFPDSIEMEKFIQRIYGRTGTEPTESSPISVTYMPDGSRISCTFGSQVSKPGPIIAIRKFPESPLTITHIISGGGISEEAAAYLWTLLDAKAVGLVIGVTGSGKTTLLSSLMTMMNPRWRIVTIEDTLELQVPHSDWVRYNTRKSYGMLASKYDIKIKDLIDSSLTQRPDFEVIGEIRLNDMEMLFQSVGTGHGGLTSFHASTAEGAITRMRGNKISDGEIALTWFCMNTRLVDLHGKNVRRVNNISEIVPDETGKIKIEAVYEYDVFVDKLLNKKPLDECARYIEACTVCGIRDGSEDMKKRMGLLNECVKQEAKNPKAVFDILRRYYERRV